MVEDSVTLERRPSEVTDVAWVFAKRKFGTYPPHTENAGKWLIFVSIAHLDEVWAKIKTATEQGLLGESAKAATARTNPNAANSATKVICVYSYDWTDEMDVKRIREELRKLGIVSKIPYKTQEDSYAKKYAKRGDKQISKYFE